MAIPSSKELRPRLNTLCDLIKGHIYGAVVAGEISKKTADDLFVVAHHHAIRLLRVIERLEEVNGKAGFATAEDVIREQFDPSDLGR